MKITPLDFATPGLTVPCEIIPRRFDDERGFFAETFNAPALHQAGVGDVWIQDNQSLSRPAFTLRGLHYQLAPHAQAKLVRVLKGEILDVVVDIRKNSPALGQWRAVTLSASAFNQLYVPAGFAHGFLTLTPDTEVMYKVSALYSPTHERAINWQDPDLAITWPVPATQSPILSAKDALAPSFKDVLKAGDIF